MRIGIGYDIHRLGAGNGVVLGGVYIPFEKSLIGHSDADVLLHAICDALLGAAGEGDIGVHFPNNNPAIKGISSIELLRKTNMIIGNKGYKVSNIDSVLLAEEPRISPYRDTMIKNISAAIGAEPGQVHVKATTNEGLGSIGRGEGIAAYAVCILTLKNGQNGE
ncbi:MAG: 2-C-methyl-D-erythritol 2,4-cyclodiphosphate synthase [Nitrospirae bacterium]|nr:2-C-methyl-D-erythritol 2,4-cyclodiphosphate synthase [Nitrospirota bacterium]